MPTESESNLIEALQSQIDAARRLDSTVEQARNRLRVLDVRFDELVARAIEVGVGAGDSDLLGLGPDLGTTAEELARRLGQLEEDIVDMAVPGRTALRHHR